MLKKLAVAAALVVLFGAPGGAQTPAPGAAPNARTVLQAADAAIGASRLNAVEYSGTGLVTALGQNYSSSLDDTWPRFDLKNYRRVIDYLARSMREEQVRVQGSWPANKGGGQRPIIGERRQVQAVNGNNAWNLNDQNVAAPAIGQADARQLEILMTPHGFIRAALNAPDATAQVQSENARSMRKVTIVSFKALGKYPMTGWFNEQNLLTKTTTWLPQDMLGDMFVETRVQGGYKDVAAGIKFPNGFHQSIGNPPHPGYDIQISDVKVNVPGATQQVPDNVRNAAAQPIRVTSQQVAPGVWMLGGSGYYVTVVDFRDYAVMVEAPNSTAYGEAVIAEAKRLTGKPIRFVVNTHHHFDHAGGLRAAGAEDIVVITHESNFPYYEGVVFDLRPRLLNPDKLSMAPRQVHYVLVKNGYRITDGTRIMDIQHIEDLEHAEDMLIAWLPAEKIVVQADMYNAPAAGAPPPAPNAGNIVFLNNLERLGMVPERMISVHSGLHPMAEYLRVVGVPRINARGGGGNAALNSGL
jgi:glyoxylase-like metal-dependent hydrolase (beta-lactamase superfamily II)